MKDFEIFCDLLNQECIILQEKGKEYIDDILAFEAYVYISQMKLDLPGDFLLFLSSLNLLNTYVKQPEAKIGYSFKKHIDYFLEKCLKSDTNILKFYKDNDKIGKLLIIKLNNIQFSFHGVNCQYETIDKSNEEIIEWDGIRKQQCAVTIYNMCKENKLLRTNLTYRGDNLEEKVKRFVENYKKGLMNFKSKI